MTDLAVYLPVPTPKAEETESSGYSPPNQNPTIFWIGCSDARVPESAVLPGKEIFVQRNIANQFHLVDGNALACLAFAVSLSSIEEIMIVGHTDCGGVKACHDAAHGRPPPLHWAVWSWLGPLKELARSDKNRPERQLIEQNVRVQAANVRSALRTLTQKELRVSGHVYDLGTGRLEEVELNVL